ncbi:MAG: pectate lyase [Candidatus Hydrogenedentes bacterium]|nr:pectate lyase [Candidatus Hydrogenedentota bacterium]
MKSRPESIILLLCIALFPALVPAGPLPAFPGAEGAGAFTPGGRGGVVLFVTTLEDYAPGDTPIAGSFRAAVDTPGPRTILFRVSGTIELKAALSVQEPFVTIAGQSAPGGGVATKNHGVVIRTHDVIVRHLRCRPGDEVGRALAKEGRDWSTDALSIAAPSRNVILDHCSASWANDEVLSVSGAGITDVTVQWCIISESLNESTHGKGQHGYGSLIRANGAVSFHHNLYAFHRSRSPRPGTYGEGSILFDFRNNVMYQGGQGYSAEDPVRMNFVGNHHPDTPFNATDTCEHYSDANVGAIRGGKPRAIPFDTAPVTTTSADAARAAVLDGAGAILPARDAADARVIALVRAGNGALLDRVEDAGGWPRLEGAAPPADRDGDGMPDAWEAAHGLDPDTPDHNGDPDGDGYTNLEEFLNGTDPMVR